MPNYPNSGALFPLANRKSDRAPNLTGFVEINRELYNELGQMFDQATGNVRINLSGWTKTAKSGQDYISVNASSDKFRQQRGGAGPDPTITKAPKQNSIPGMETPAGRRSKPSIDDEIPF